MLIQLKELWKKRNIRGYEENEINIKKLKELQKQGAILIDVRSPQEYREGHLEGAILLPKYEIKTEVKKVIPDKKEIIIVYCSSGVRSKKAKQELIKMGYENIYNLENGLENY